MATEHCRVILRTETDPAEVILLPPCGGDLGAINVEQVEIVLTQMSLGTFVQIRTEKDECQIESPRAEGQHDGCDMKFLLAGFTLGHLSIFRAWQ